MDYTPYTGDKVLVARNVDTGGGPTWVPPMDDCLGKVGEVIGPHPHCPNWIEVIHLGAKNGWFYDISWLEPVFEPVSVGADFDETKGDF